jgi:CHAT domain
MSRARRPIKVLVFAASPTDRAKISSGREIRAMKAELAHAPHGNRFKIVVCFQAEPLDLLREMSRVKPDIVHIIAHGAGTGSFEHRSCSCPSPDRDIIAENAAGAAQDGLFFVDEDGRTRFLSAAALEHTFAAAGKTVRLVVLAVCHSAAHAVPLLAHVEAVVSVTGLLHDQSAVAYTTGLYLSLGAGRSLDVAHKAGRAAITLAGLCDGNRPQLQVRDDLRPERIFLAGRPGRSTARRKRKRAGEAVLATTPRRRTPRRRRSDPGGAKQSSQPRRKRGDRGRAKPRSRSRGKR